jgi:ribosome modulation factor
MWLISGCSSKMCCLETVFAKEIWLVGWIAGREWNLELVVEGLWVDDA